MYFKVDCATVSIGQIGFCNCVPCSEDEGDCDFHDECQDNLLCGTKNCPHPHINSQVDCCYAPIVRDCTINNPCAEYEGDCDTDYECLDHLSCGTNNCLASLGFSKDADCCEDIGVCIDYSWKGDAYCDDGNNNEGCEWDGGDCCGNNVNTEYCSVCECLDPDAQGSKRKHCLSPHDSIQYRSRSMSKKNTKPKISARSININNFEKELKLHLLTDTNIRKSQQQRRKGRFPRQRNSKSLKQIVQRNSSADIKNPTELRKSHYANFKFGLTVVLNPNEAEYGEALKNSYTGFKTLVHTPYDFAEVDAVGMAIDQNSQSFIGIRGHHAWTTDAANSLDLLQKKCLARDDDLTKYPMVKLDVFEKYTRKGCILECHANLYYKKCKCLPYHYPNFTQVWNETTTACDYNGLKCLSTVNSKYFTKLDILYFGALQLMKCYDRN